MARNDQPNHGVSTHPEVEKWVNDKQAKKAEERKHLPYDAFGDYEQTGVKPDSGYKDGLCEICRKQWSGTSAPYEQNASDDHPLDRFAKDPSTGELA